MTITAADLSKFDFELLIDTSGSMSTPVPGGKTRLQWSQEQSEAVARACEKFDTDGITVVAFQNSFKTYENTTADKVHQIFTENEPGGGTDTAGVLKSRIDAYFARKAQNGASTKPTILVVITDGAPNNEKEVEKVIVDATQKLDNGDELSITFFQVGDDENAAKFLQHLDDELENAGAKFDIVDTKRWADLENMRIVDALVAAVND